MQISIDVNGRAHAMDVEGNETLLDLLRDRLGLTGTKRVCDEGTCGQCTVLLDGLPVFACILLAASCRGRVVQTIEALALDGRLHPLQRMLIDGAGLACGFCASAWVMALRGLLDVRPDSDEVTIADAVAGVVCRCGAGGGLMAAAQRHDSSA